MDDHVQGLAVELILNGFKITGQLQIEERRRLGDILNTADELFQLADATVTPALGAPRAFRSLPIEKRSILAAIPRETEEQSRRRAVLSTGLGRSTAAQTPLWLLIPPLMAEGLVHVGFATGGIRSLDSHSVPRFFALTEAKIYLEERRGVARRAGATRPPDELGVVFINRDLVAAVGPLKEAVDMRRGLAVRA